MGKEQPLIYSCEGNGCWFYGIHFPVVRNNSNTHTHTHRDYLHLFFFYWANFDTRACDGWLCFLLSSFFRL